MGQIVGKCYKICQSLVTKHHVSGTIARLYLPKNNLQFFNPIFTGIELGIDGKSAALNR